MNLLLSETTMYQPTFSVKTTQIHDGPLISMKKIKSHSSSIFGSTSVLFPDGKMKIVTCSSDKTLRIFDLETEKCEKIFFHSSPLYGIHFYKEQRILMTTDFNGELILWDIFSSPKPNEIKIKIIERIEVSKPRSCLFRISQISEYLFFCCVQGGSSRGSLYSIAFNRNIKNRILKIEEIIYYYNPSNNNNNKEIKKAEIFCIYKLKSEKNTILFSGGLFKDFSIKKYNFMSRNHFRFENKHSMTVYCLSSYFNEKNEEIIISGSHDGRIIFWNLENGKIRNEEKLIILKKGWCYCFLNFNVNIRRKRNYLFIATGGYTTSDYSISSLDLKTRKIKKIVDKIHREWIHCIKWIDEKQNRFISYSHDNTFNIFELEELPNDKIFEVVDLDERIRFIRDEEFIQNYFSSETNKKMLFSIRYLDNFKINNIFKVFFWG